MSLCAIPIASPTDHAQLQSTMIGMSGPAASRAARIGSTVISCSLMWR